MAFNCTLHWSDSMVEGCCCGLMGTGMLVTVLFFFLSLLLYMQGEEEEDA